MYPFERREKILNKLRRNGQIDISEDAEVLGVSIATFHRDLEVLAKQGLVKKVRGGAIPVKSAQFETHFDIRMRTRTKEKEEIARKAVKTVEDDSSIFLDHSSTTLFLARQLNRLSFRNLLVLTNSLVTPLELAGNSGIQVRLTGGIFENEFKALSGLSVIESLQSLNLHQVFASVGAISLEQGLMTQIPFIHDILPGIFLCGRRVNILADSSKFSKIGTFQIAALDASLRIFSDRGVPDDLRKKIHEKGPELII